MRDHSDADPLTEYPPLHLVFQAVLAQDLMAFTEFAFGVIRPGNPFQAKLASRSGHRETVAGRFWSGTTSHHHSAAANA